MKQSPQQTTHPFLDLEAEPILQIVALFQKREEQLKFPDLDAKTLSAGLEQLESQRDVVEAAAVALDQARQALLVKEHALLEQARRAHAYASIFAANDEELGAALAEIKLSAPGKAARSRDVKKRRPLPEPSDVQEAKSNTGPSGSLKRGAKSAKASSLVEQDRDEPADEVAAE